MERHREFVRMFQESSEKLDSIEENSLDRIVYEEFPIKKSAIAYFNNASYTPMSNSAIKSIAEALQTYSSRGPDDSNYLQLKAGGDLARQKLGQLLKMPKEGIILTESATQGINLIANGYKFTRGDFIITRGGSSEHPSNFLPWKFYAEEKGLRIIDLEVDSFGSPDLSSLDSSLKASKAKLVVLSHVLYNLGTVQPAKEVAKIAHERGAHFFLDVSQSVGNVEVNLAEIDCDFAAGTAAKWLCGPLGLGFAYCKKDVIDFLEPLNFGPNACTYDADGNYSPHPSAMRFQEGFRNWAYAFGFGAAIDLISEYTVARAHKKSLALADMLIQRIQSQPRRFGFLGAVDQRLRTSIVPVDSLQEKPAEVVARLRNRGITIAEREIGRKKILRISPHFYNDIGEMEKLCQSL